MAIKCGKCKGYHDSVTEVKWCHNVVVPQSAQQAFGLEPKPVYAPLAEKVVSTKEPVTEGFYKLEDDIIKVVESRQGRLYGKKLELFYDEESHTKPTKGVWEYVPGIMGKLTAEMKLSQDEAAEFGQLYGVCAICGTVLTNEESIERGIGPVCIKKVEW